MYGTPTSSALTISVDPPPSKLQMSDFLKRRNYRQLTAQMPDAIIDALESNNIGR
jgi:hypothetical protein